ncbi:hypothetical protein WA538_001593 [Blastocystis sp. DL]
MESEEEPETIPRTEHEIPVDAMVVEDYHIDPTWNLLLVRAGRVSHILDDSYIIDAGQNTKAIEENTILFRQSMEPVGRIMEVFGQVEHPYYMLRWPKSVPNPNLSVGDTVFMNNADVHFILPAQLNTIGTDASNVYDEEPTEAERVAIECTEDVRGEEVPDESGITDINYQQDFVIPNENPRRMAFHSQRMLKMQKSVSPSASVSYSSSTPSATPVSVPPAPKPDNSGMVILMNSYF